MSISALLTAQEAENWALERARAGGSTSVSVGRAVVPSPSSSWPIATPDFIFWDSTPSVNNLTSSISFLFAPNGGQQPMLSIPLLPSPRIQPGMFDDLPPIPSQETVARIIEIFFEHVNPSFNYTVHVLSFFGKSWQNDELLLLFAMLAAAASSLTNSHPSGQAISLAFFRRAQRLLQPILGSLIQARKPTVHQLSAILIMSAHASTAFSSSQLGFQLGLYCVGVFKIWGFYGGRVHEHRSKELSWAVGEVDGGLPEAIMASQSSSSLMATTQSFPTVIERESLRRVVWQAYCMDKTGSTATPFLGVYGNAPLMPVASVAGLLLPCDNQTWISESDPIKIAASLSNGIGEEIGRDSVTTVPDVMKKDRIWWYLRLHSILSRIVEYHVVGFRQAIPAFLILLTLPDFCCQSSSATRTISIRKRRPKR
jgi:hypothetical protein